MKKVILGITAPALAAAALMSVPTLAQADLAYHVGATTDYRYRGISQSRLKPAVHAGVDFADGGLYLGAWVSTIKWIKDFGGDANVEVDLYGGYKGEIQTGLAYDVGVLTYQYPSNKLKPIGGANANTTEVYGALTFGPATAKVSYALTDTFGNVILEALACGVPCVVSDQGGPKDLVEHGKTGYVTRALDAADFARRVPGT